MYCLVELNISQLLPIILSLSDVVCFSFDKMASDELRAYNRRGGMVVGILEIVIGAVVFFFQIPLFKEYTKIATWGTGFWAGVIVSWSYCHLQGVLAGSCLSSWLGLSWVACGPLYGENQWDLCVNILGMTHCSHNMYNNHNSHQLAHLLLALIS